MKLVHAQSDLDSPEAYGLIRSRLQHKSALRRFYKEVYAKYVDCLNRCPRDGVALEIGSGAGFAKDVMPELETSDILAYPGVDRQLDACALDYPEESLRAIFMLNVFHHIPDVAAFLSCAERCLVPGGRLLIVDQHVGLLSRFILGCLHREPFDPSAVEWTFRTSGPLSGANGALAWIVFRRDRGRFDSAYPLLRLLRYEPHSPLRYWLAGGLKWWSLLPGCLWTLATRLDRMLVERNADFGSFVDIEIVKVAR